MGGAWDSAHDETQKKNKMSTLLQYYSISSTYPYARRRRQISSCCFCLWSSRTCADDLWPPQPASQPTGRHGRPTVRNCTSGGVGLGGCKRRISAVPGWAYLQRAGRLSLAACWAGMGLGCVPTCPMSQLESRMHYRHPSSCSWA